VRALVAQEDEKIGHLVAHLLRGEGQLVEECWRSTDALRLMRLGGYGLVVLDTALSPVDGFTVCREARGLGLTAPILMLGASTNIDDRVRGLESGADDFLDTPFAPEELLARVRALLRRQTNPVKVEYGGVEVDRLDRRVTVAGENVRLTAREFSLLVCLADGKGAVVTRAALLAALCDGSSESRSNAVDVHLCHLRAKMGPHAWRIETVRGKGFRLRRRRDPDAE
jgi:DNA-binding response OmpR family regulator